MDYYDKYLRYKLKYLNLRKQIGGDNELVNVVWSSSEFLKVLPGNFDYSKLKNDKFNIFKLSFLNKHANQVIQEIDERVPCEMKSSLFASKWASVANQRIIAGIYDSISLFYLSSPKFQDYWREIERQFGMKIKIFYGETTSVNTEAFKQRESDFIEGLNILLSCQSHDLAYDLTQKYYAKGKYFLGFKFFAHLYGATMVKCKKTLTDVFTQTFLDSAKCLEIAGQNPPTIQLINIMFYLFKKECPNCRECIFIDNDNIIRKIRAIKDKMSTKKPLTRAEAYFAEENGLICNREIDICEKDSEIDTFIKSKLSGPIVPIDYTNREYFKL